jgi:hypothetical protein
MEAEKAQVEAYLLRLSDAEAEAWSDLVRTWWETSRHGRRMTFARLRRFNYRLTEDQLKDRKRYAKNKDGYKLAEEPLSVTKMFYKKGML